MVGRWEAVFQAVMRGLWRFVVVPILASSLLSCTLRTERTVSPPSEPSVSVGSLPSELEQPREAPQEAETPSKEGEPRERAEEPLLADWIVVIKSQRVMRLLRKGEVIREYNISLGKNPVGHKIRQGDNRTPEGLYIISGRNPKSAYHLALRISYPDPIDVINARAMGVKPGGNIMIHGLPNGVKNKYLMEKDWTNGCIAVSNEEIEEIWNLVPDGTPIEILP